MSSTTKETQPKGYRIGDLTVDLVRREIRRQGRILPCGKLTFELLILLAQHAPGVVSRSVLAERLWSGRFVSQATIKRRVSLLREALGDRAEDPVYLRVVRGHGYALVPKVEPMGRFAVKRTAWIRFAAAAGALIVTFFVGAEVGYQDGLKPAIPSRQGTQTVIVTAWPHELSSDEYEFVVGAANGLIDAVRHTGFLDRLDLPSAGEERIDRESLTVLARATTNDVEAIYVTLGLFRDDRPDTRPSRDNELALWSRELQDVRRPAYEGIESNSSVDTDTGLAVLADYRTHVLPATSDDRTHLMLVANYRFDRDEMRAIPREFPAEIADTVATAIDRQMPQPAAGPAR